MQRKWAVLACLLSACSEEARALRPLTATPGCFVRSPVETHTSTTWDVRREAQAARQVSEFGLSFVLQRTQFVVRPALDEPGIDEWFQERRHDGTLNRSEGHVVFDGREAFVLYASTALYSVDTGDLTWSEFVEVTQTPAVTRYLLSNASITVADDYIRTDQVTLGCDPKTGISFSIGADWVEDPELRMAATVLTCWRNGEVFGRIDLAQTPLGLATWGAGLSAGGGPAVGGELAIPGRYIPDDFRQGQSGCLWVAEQVLNPL